MGGDRSEAKGARYLSYTEIAPCSRRNPPSWCPCRQRTARSSAHPLQQRSGPLGKACNDLMVASSRNVRLGTCEWVGLGGWREKLKDSVQRSARIQVCLRCCRTRRLTVCTRPRCQTSCLARTTSTAESHRRACSGPLGSRSSGRQPSPPGRVGKRRSAGCHYPPLHRPARRPPPTWPIISGARRTAYCAPPAYSTLAFNHGPPPLPSTSAQRYLAVSVRLSAVSIESRGSSWSTGNPSQSHRLTICW